MSSFADYRLRVIGCSNKTFNGKCAPKEERDLKMLDV
jgi:hypothetical protein